MTAETIEAEVPAADALVQLKKHSLMLGTLISYSHRWQEEQQELIAAAYAAADAYAGKEAGDDQTDTR